MLLETSGQSGLLVRSLGRQQERRTTASVTSSILEVRQSALLSYRPGAKIEDVISLAMCTQTTVVCTYQMLTQHT